MCLLNIICFDWGPPVILLWGSPHSGTQDEEGSLLLAKSKGKKSNKKTPKTKKNRVPFWCLSKLVLNLGIPGTNYSTDLNIFIFNTKLKGIMHCSSLQGTVNPCVHVCIHNRKKKNCKESSVASSCWYGSGILLLILVSTAFGSNTLKALPLSPITIYMRMPIERIHVKRQ